MQISVKCTKSDVQVRNLHRASVCTLICNKNNSVTTSVNPEIKSESAIFVTGAALGDVELTTDHSRLMGRANKKLPSFHYAKAVDGVVDVF